MTLGLAYGALVLVLVVMVGIRHETTLLRGGGLLVFHAAVLVIAAGASALGAVPPAPYTLGVFTLLVAAAFAGRRTWWLLGDDPERTARVLEEALERVLARHERTPDGFRLTSRAGPVLVRLSNPIRRLGRLRIESPTPDRKLALFRSLVGKQFRPALPRVTIRLKSSTSPGGGGRPHPSLSR